MGILDNKSRIVDTVITNEGRRQLATGRMKIEYYTFTDGDAFYQSSSAGVVDDGSSRFYFEAPSTLPDDQITFEADDSGLLKFDKHPELNIVNGDLIEGTLITDSLKINTNNLTGSAFASATSNILTSSFDSFKNLRVIATNDRLFGDDGDGFSLSENSFDIKISNGTNLFKKRDNTLTISAANIPDFIGEKKLSRSTNFQFLPPMKPLPEGVKASQLTKEEQRSYSLGTYSNLSPSGLNFNYILKGEDLNLDDGIASNNTNFNGIEYSQQKGFCKNIQIYSSPQSKKMVMQVFEVTSGRNQVRKLDVIDAGAFGDEESGTASRVFFIGRILYDNGRYVFANIFTMVFDR